MGFFARLGNMVNGFLSLFIGKIEEKNPAAVYEAAIQERIKTHKELKKAISNIVFLRNKAENELESMQTELENVKLELEGALMTGQDDLSIMLIEKQDQLEASIASKQVELQGISKQADDSMEQLQQFEGEIQKLKREKDEMLAKEANASAQIKIQEALNGLSVDADIQALGNVRESIEKKAAEARVGAELADNSLDNKLDKLRQEGAKSRAHARLEEMKRARREAQGQTQTTTQSDSDRLEALKNARQGDPSDTPPSPPSGSGGKTI